jgi:hypothetical protein
LNDQEIFTVQGSLAMDPMISLGEDPTTGQQRPPLKFPAKKEDEPLLTQLVILYSKEFSYWQDPPKILEKNN